MARARTAEQQRSRSKTTPLEEISLGITKFQEVVATIHDISQEGFPYRDAAQSKAELQFRECLRQTFGERSQEFQNSDSGQGRRRTKPRGHYGSDPHPGRPET